MTFLLPVYLPKFHNLTAPVTSAGVSSSLMIRLISASEKAYSAVRIGIIPRLLRSVPPNMISTMRRRRFDTVY